MKDEKKQKKEVLKKENAELEKMQDNLIAKQSTVKQMRRHSARSSGGLRSMPRQRGGSRSMTRAGTGESRRTALRGS